MVLPLNVWKDWYISDCVTDTGGGSSWGTPTFKKRKTKGLVNIQSAIQRIRVTGQGVIPTEKSKDEMTVKYSAGFLLNISNWARKKKHIYMTMQWLHNECEKEILVISQVHGRLADMPKNVFTDRHFICSAYYVKWMLNLAIEFINTVILGSLCLTATLFKLLPVSRDQHKISTAKSNSITRSRS